MLLKIVRASVSENIINVHYCLILTAALAVSSAFLWLTSYFSDGDVRNNFSMSVYILMMLAMVYAVIRTVASFSGEIDDRTLDILMSLPVERRTVYFGKILGLTIIMTPLIILPVIIYFAILGVVIGAIPTITIGIALEYTLLTLLVIVAIILITALISVMLRKTLYSLGVSGFYLFGMLFLSPIINDFSSQKIVYEPNYVALFPFPYAVLAAGTKSVRVMNGVDVFLIGELLLFCAIMAILGLLVFRRMDL